MSSPANLYLNILLAITLGLYLYQIRLRKSLTRGKILIIVLSILLVVGLNSFIARLSNSYLYTLIPYLGGTVFLVLDIETALIITALASISTSAFIAPDLRVVSYYLLGGWAASYMAAFYTDRYSIYRIILAVFFTLGLSGLIFWPNTNVGQIFNAAFLSALFSGLLTLGILPLFERFFGISTDLLLLELINPNHPLLKEFAARAPGSFSHSQTIANLAEAAARRLGLNPLLARVMALYHDIGKMQNPEYFIENQVVEGNPHEGLPPEESVKVLKKHIEYGVEIAKKYGLPAEVVNGIKTHHGTTVMEYFYGIASKLNQDVSKDQYRYPGPKPSSKLEAILMLADTIEAATRTIPNPDPHSLRTKVRELIEKRLNEGQLDHTDLTRRDLQDIEEAFVQVLLGIHHSRIEYPQK